MQPHIHQALAQTIIDEKIQRAERARIASDLSRPARRIPRVPALRIRLLAARLRVRAAERH